HETWVDEAPRQSRPRLDEQVGDAALAELAQDAGQVESAGRYRRNRNDLHAGGGKGNARPRILGGFLRAEDDHFALVRRSGQLAVRGQPQVAVEDDARELARRRNATGGEEWVVL